MEKEGEVRKKVAVVVNTAGFKDYCEAERVIVSISGVSFEYSGDVVLQLTDRYLFVFVNKELVRVFETTGIEITLIKEVDSHE